MKFYDFYVWKATPLNETKFIRENDIPVESEPLNIVEVNYETLFDPPENARLFNVIIYHSAQSKY